MSDETNKPVVDLQGELDRRARMEAEYRRLADEAERKRQEERRVLLRDAAVLHTPVGQVSSNADASQRIVIVGIDVPTEQLLKLVVKLTLVVAFVAFVMGLVVAAFTVLFSSVRWMIT